MPGRAFAAAGVALALVLPGATALAQKDKPTPPELITKVEAEYPAKALEKKVEAEVLLQLDISATGKVESVKVVEPATPAGLGFDEAAVAAARLFEFKPAELKGKPVAVQITYRYKFRLPTKEEEAEPAETPGEAPPATSEAGGRVVNLSGQLVERGTRAPLVGVTVTVFRGKGGKGEGYEAVSDENGVFEFYDLEPGNWRILARPPGYYPLRTSETVAQGEKTEVVFHIERGSYNPYDVTVTERGLRKEVNRTVLSAAQIDKVPGTAGDPLNVVQNFGGVARVSALGLNSLFGASFVVRGSAPEDTAILVEGTSVPLLHHFGGLKSVISVGVLDSIEFYPGNFSPMYGRATGGVVDIRIKELRPKKVGGYVDISLLDAGAYLEAPLGDKGGIAIAGRRSYIDGVMLAAVPDDAPVSLVTAPRYYDFQLVANYRPEPQHDLRALVLGSDDRVRLLFKNPADLDPGFESNAVSAMSSFYRSRLSYRYVPSERFENEFSVSQGRTWVDINLAQLFFEGQIYHAQVRDTLRHKLTDNMRIMYGADIVFSREDGEVNLPRITEEGMPPGSNDVEDTVTSSFQDEDYLSPAGFVELDYRPFEPLVLLPGVRVDSFAHTGGKVVAQPRFTTRYQVSKSFTLKGGVGLFAVEPQAHESDEEIGNPDLDPERAWHYSGGFEVRPREFLTIDITGFYKYLYRLVRPSDELVMEDGELTEVGYDNLGEGRVVGAELSIRHDFNNNLFGWLTYTYSRAERRDPGGEYRPFDFDQPHILNLVGAYLLPRNWQIGARFRLVSGNPSTPVIGSTYNATADRYDPIYGVPNSERIDAFHQLDLRVDKRWIYRSWILNAYLDIQNVYNRANPEGVAYSYDFGESENQPGLPLLTILGVRAEF